mgnify:CR=1 FL=1
MLKTLDIENIAVIEKASVDFSGGLNVLTGETGAGKSIVVDSINAIMGERTSRELVRYGADNAYVSAYFDDICDSALNKLKKFDIELEEDNSLLITRKISANGKSLCKVNGKTVTVSMLKEICSYLVNVHGQHDSQALLNPDLQYNYIDMLLKDKSVLSDYKETFKKLISVRRKLKSFAKDEDNKESLLELLNFQIEELEKADIQVESKTVNLENYLVQISTGKKNYDLSSTEKIDNKNAYIIINAQYKFLLKDKENGDVEITYEGVAVSGDLTLSSYDGTYTYPNSGSFEITNNASGGELTVNSDAPNIATVSLDGNTVTVKPRYNSWKG